MKHKKIKLTVMTVVLFIVGAGLIFLAKYLKETLGMQQYYGALVSLVVLSGAFLAVSAIICFLNGREGFHD